MKLPFLDFSQHNEISERVRYHISQLVDYFHAVPHVDVNLQPVNATFDPSNNYYLESVGILVAIPGFWLILTLFAFLVFFLCRCCDSNAKKKKRITPLKWILSFFALLACGVVYGTPPHKKVLWQDNRSERVVYVAGRILLAENVHELLLNKFGGALAPYFSTLIGRLGIKKRRTPKILGLRKNCDALYGHVMAATPFRLKGPIEYRGVGVLGCGALSLGLFGNDQAHQALLFVQRSTAEMETVVKSVRNETLLIEQILDNSIREDVDQISVAFSAPLPNATVRSMVRETLAHMRANISQSLAKTKDMNIKMKALDLRNLPQWLQIIEFFRWPGTIGLQCSLIFICLLLLWGVIRHSRCLLILFSVLGLLSVVLCWVLVSLYFGLAVAGADFCFNPEPFFNRMAGHNPDERLAIEYYMTCEEMTNNPFKIDIIEAKRAVHDLQSNTQILKRIAEQYMPQQDVRALLHALEKRLEETERTLSRMATLVECTTIQNEYLNAMEAICVSTFEGTVFMLASAAASGLLFTVLIWIASHTWIHIRSRHPRARSDPTDDEGRPFLAGPVCGNSLSRVGASAGTLRNTYAVHNIYKMSPSSASAQAAGSVDGYYARHDKRAGSQKGLTSKSNARLAYLYDANNFFPPSHATQGPAHAGVHVGHELHESLLASSGEAGGRPDSPLPHRPLPITAGAAAGPGLGLVPAGDLQASPRSPPTPAEPVGPIDGFSSALPPRDEQWHSDPAQYYRCSDVMQNTFGGILLERVEIRQRMHAAVLKSSRGNGREDQAFLHARYTPPPA
ncbi:protein tweety-2-like, partial [Tropilaelaps mercedesae]